MNAAVGLADQKAESAPEEPLAVSALLENKSLEMKRVWLGVIAMGGADFMEPVEEPPEQVTPLTDEERAQRLMLLALRNADRSSLDAEAIAVLDELLPIAERWTELTAYDLLNIAKDATTEAVQDAYFSYAKRLHSDVLRGMGLGQQILDVAETIFSQIGAAHKTLSDSDERSTYDFMMDRKARGLPTDVK
ncbi:DnaJ domain-containing protein, partial [Myxococcota bacterium]|nr:DnaJ domain-containing protein [Myxococcota bacterium]